MDGRQIAVLRELIKYVVSRVSDHEGTLGVTRLVKLLYLIDIEYYRRHRRLLTNLIWVFYLYGPYAFEIPDTLRSLDLELPQADISLGDRRVLHAFRRGYAADTEVDGLADPSIATLINRVVDTWALENLNRLLSHVYFDTEPMRGAKPNEVLDFAKIPEPTFGRVVPKVSLKLTADEAYYFRSRLAEHKEKVLRLRELAEAQHRLIHGREDPVLERAVKKSQEMERIHFPDGALVVAMSLEESALSDEFDDV